MLPYISPMYTCMVILYHYAYSCIYGATLYTSKLHSYSSPISLSMDECHDFEFGVKLLKHYRTKRFCECVCNLQGVESMLNLHPLTNNFFTHEIDIELNILYVSTKNMIMWQQNNIKIVLKKSERKEIYYYMLGGEWFQPE